MAASKLRTLAAELRAYEDTDEVTETQIHVHGGTVLVGETGRSRAMSKSEAEEITKTDHGKPSDPPPSKVSPLSIAWVMARKFPPWGAVLVALAGIIAYVVLKR